MTIAGGSPAATLWAVYELVERWGVRYLLSGDVFPARRPDFVLPQIDKVFEPGLRLRWWRTMGDFAMGTEGWGMADYRPLIDQLAKLKFNRIRVGSGPSQPFCNWTSRASDSDSPRSGTGTVTRSLGTCPAASSSAVRRSSGTPTYPCPRTATRSSPRPAWRHCHALIAYAHDRGMQASFVGSILDFPKEFRGLFPTRGSSTNSAS